MMDLDRIARREIRRQIDRETAIRHGRGRPDMLMLNHLSGFGAGGDPGDPYWSSVVLAMHMDGSDGSTAFTDLKGHSVTRNGAPTISTTQSKFGGASGNFDGVDDSLYITHADLSWGGAFTCDFWIYPTSANTEFCSFTSGNNWEIYFPNSTTLDLRINNNISPRAAQWTGGSLLSAWHYIEVCRDSSNVCYLFVDGSLGATSNSDATPFTSVGGHLYLMQYYSGGYFCPGYMDDFRLTLGAARHTAGYSVPTAAFLEA